MARKTGMPEILVSVREAGGSWFAVAYHDGELVATSTGDGRGDALDAVRRCLCGDAAWRISQEGTPFLEDTVRMLAEIREGREENKHFRLSDSHVPEPLRRILYAAAAIPPGWVSTYGAVAAAAGTVARAVGRAMATNRLYPIVACHRVVGSDLSLVGYGGRQDRAALLSKLSRLKAEARGYLAEKTPEKPAPRLFPVERVLARAARDGLDGPREPSLFD